MSGWLVIAATLAAGLAVGAGVAVWWLRLSHRRPLPVVPEKKPVPNQVEPSPLAAVAAERERIYRDLHDDIGSKLLTLAHSTEGTPQSEIAREILQDLRSVISGAHAAEGSLLEVLAHIQEESERRLETAGVRLNWVQDDNLPDPDLDEAKALHVFRIVREAITNALRHARPAQLRIRANVLANALIIDVTDDSEAVLSEERIGAGSGTRSMRARAEELRGSISWDRGTQGGTKVLLRVPLPDIEKPHEA